MIKAVLGIDPGATGAACLLMDDGGVSFLDWPKDHDLYAVRDQLYAWNREYVLKGAVLEKVSSMPGQGVKSMFSFGTNNGLWLMGLTFIDVPLFRPTPQQWQKSLVTKSDGGDPKTRAYQVARRLFPQAVLKGPQGGIKTGRCDALLMACFARDYFGMVQVQQTPVRRRSK
jgi:crossover junction endodeoxyribonuclease RuvC